MRRGPPPRSQSQASYTEYHNLEHYSLKTQHFAPMDRQHFKITSNQGYDNIDRQNIYILKRRVRRNDEQ